MKQLDPRATGGGELPIGFIARGRGDAQGEIESLGRLDEGIAHVVAVANPHHGAPGDVAAVLHIGLNVGEKLAGVLKVGERVDDGNQRVRRESLDALVLEGAHDDGIGHT